MKQKYYSLIALFAIIGIILISGCVKENPATQGVAINGTVTIEGTFENLGHPFTGPAIVTSQGDYYRVSGEKAQEIIALEDRTKIKVIGTLSEYNRTIPEAGAFREITEKVINVTSFEIIG